MILLTDPNLSLKDPDVPDKCVLNVSTYAGGDCTGNIQCDETDQPGADIGAFPNCALNGEHALMRQLSGSILMNLSLQELIISLTL